MDTSLIVIIIVMAIIMAILLVIIGYFFYQNRTLKKTISNLQITHKVSKNATENDGIYEQPLDVLRRREIDTDHEYVEDLDDGATYTALDRTGRDNGDHVYCHLNLTQQGNMNETETGI